MNRQIVNNPRTCATCGNLEPTNMATVDWFCPVSGGRWLPHESCSRWGMTREAWIADRAARINAQSEIYARNSKKRETP